MLYRQEILLNKMRRRRDVFIKQSTPRAKIVEQNAPQTRFFGLNPEGLFVLLMQYVIHSLFTHQGSE